MSSYRLKPFSDDPCPPAEVDPNRHETTPAEDEWYRDMEWQYDEAPATREREELKDAA